MFIDASALSAILIGEHDAPVLVRALSLGTKAVVTDFVLMETGLAGLRELQRSADTIHREMNALLDRFAIETTPLTPPMILTALKAYERYGKGRGHPAQLNMGDCLSYAAATVLNLPLLYKGDDFARTDIVSAAVF